MPKTAVFLPAMLCSCGEGSNGRAEHSQAMCVHARRCSELGLRLAAGTRAHNLGVELVFPLGEETMKIESTRRSFLGAAAGIAGLSAIDVVPAGAVIEPEPWGIKLGVASYSLRMFDRAKAIEMIK